MSDSGPYINVPLLSHWDCRYPNWQFSHDNIGSLYGSWRCSTSKTASYSLIRNFMAKSSTRSSLSRAQRDNMLAWQITDDTKIILMSILQSMYRLAMWHNTPVVTYDQKVDVASPKKKILAMSMKTCWPFKNKGKNEEPSGPSRNTGTNSGIFSIRYPQEKQLLLRATSCRSGSAQHWTCGSQSWKTCCLRKTEKHCKGPISYLVSAYSSFHLSPFCPSHVQQHTHQQSD